MCRSVRGLTGQACRIGKTGSFLHERAAGNVVSEYWAKFLNTRVSYYSIMSEPQVYFMKEEGLVKSNLFEGVEKYAYIADKWDLNYVKNQMWKMVHELCSEVPEFRSIDLRPLNIWFTPASGDRHKDGGFLHYSTERNEAHMALSLRWLDRAGMDFVKEFIMHELCHLKMYQSVGSHGEYDREFQELLRDVGAPVAILWNSKEHSFQYKL